MKNVPFEVSCTFQKQWDKYNKLPDLAKKMIFMEVNGRIMPDLVTFDIYSYNPDLHDRPIEVILDIALSQYAFHNKIPGAIYFEPQHEIEIDDQIYRVDFYFDTEFLKNSGYAVDKRLKLVIECDEHDLRHITKEQVNKDYERNSTLKTAGYEVLRFSETQIYEEPYQCAKEIYDYIFQQIKIS